VKGYIYVLTNPAMPGLVKIGRSIHGGRKRAEQIDGTGVPMPFDVYFEMTFTDPEDAELSIHETLRGKRVNPAREFFCMDPESAARAVMEEWLRDPGYSLIPDFDQYLFDMVSKSAEVHGAGAEEFVEALLSEIDPAAIALAIERIRDRSRAARERIEAAGL
jgi:hypothetical protein